MTEDPYKILGVSKDASASEIKKAYKQKAMQYHPDKQSDSNKENAEEMFCKINNAYDILSDSEKRRMHDMGINNNGMQADDIFGQMFSNIFGMNRHQQQHGKTLYEVHVPITLTNVFNGCDHTTATIKIVSKCTKCEGTGFDSPHDVIQCTTCNGRGMRIQQMGPGMMMQSTCHACLGRGNTNKTNKQCTNCKGKTHVHIDKRFNLKIPKGVQNNTRITIESTDSYEVHAIISYQLDEGVRVENQDVHINIPPLSLEELFCGFTRKIELYGKPINLKTSGYFNPDKPKKLENRGLPHHNDPAKFGNVIIHYKINFTDSPALADHAPTFKEIFTKVSLKHSPM